LTFCYGVSGSFSTRGVQKHDKQLLAVKEIRFPSRFFSSISLSFIAVLAVSRFSAYGISYAYGFPGEQSKNKKSCFAVFINCLTN
jgi:hypothetical protein